MSRNPVIETKNLPAVNEAVKEYRVIEDGAYAYHLQEKEIENHYAQNVSVRRTVMDDIQQAKALQDEEDRKARILTLDEQGELELMDEELAGLIQEDIYKRNLQEAEERKGRERSDQEVALLLEEKERRRIEHAKSAMEQDRAIAKRLEKVRVTPSPEGNQHEQRMKLMSDEELARRLQQEEKFRVQQEKKKKENIKSVIEMQDEELAKYIHERDVEAAEIKFGRKKSKKKGKWKEEPLYYDDNFHPPPPQYQEVPPPSRKNGRDKKGPNRPPPPKFSAAHVTEVKVPLDSSQIQHRQHNSPRRRPDLAENGRHSPHDRHQAYSEKHSRSSDDLVDRADQHERRPPHDRRNVHSEKHSRRRGSADELDQHRSSSERHRNSQTPQDGRRVHDQPSRARHPPDSRDVDPRNHRHNEPQRSHAHTQEDPWHIREDRPPRRPDPGPRRPDPQSRTPRDKKTKEKKVEQWTDDELNYNEDFTRLTEEELAHHNNNNIEHNKPRKKSKDIAWES